MKKAFLISFGIFALKSCTPAEVLILEEVAHEASVAEQAIEDDLRSPAAPANPTYVPSRPVTKVKPVYIKEADTWITAKY